VFDDDTTGWTGISVVIVDDHPLVREGLTHRLSQLGDVDVVATAGSVADGVLTIAEHGPDVAVVDLQLPDGSGLDVCRRTRDLSPATRSILHTGAGVDALVAADAGASAVVLKSLVSDELIATIRRLAERPV
jgi:DNA-binding NarL/FixJ family response regulator